MDLVPGTADFQFAAKLALKTVEGTAASFVLNGSSHFGFDGRSQSLFLEGPLFDGGVRGLGATRDHITPGKPFRFTATRTDDRLGSGRDRLARPC